MAEKAFVYQVYKLTKIYDVGKAKIRTLDHVSFTVPEGDMLAVMVRRELGQNLYR